jgi:hypothetical protein
MFWASIARVAIDTEGFFGDHEDHDYAISCLGNIVDVVCGELAVIRSVYARRVVL